MGIMKRLATARQLGKPKHTLLEPTMPQLAEITLTKQSSRAGSNQVMFVVYRGSLPIGRIEKFVNTRTDIHPWKSYSGVGPRATYNGAFYEDGSVPDDGDVQYGGRAAAIKAITG